MLNPWNATFLGMPNNSMSVNGIRKCNEFLTNFYNNIVAFGENQGLSKTDITVFNTKGITAFEDNKCYVIVFYYRNKDIPLVEYKDLIDKTPQGRNLKLDIIDYYNANIGKVAWCVCIDKTQIDNYEKFMSDYTSYLKNEIAKQKSMEKKQNGIIINNPGIVNMGSGSIDIKNSCIIGGHNNTIKLNDREREIFNEIRSIINTQMSADEKIIQALDELENNYGKPSFKNKYYDFISSAANHMTLLAPFIPALTDMISK